MDYCTHNFTEASWALYTAKSDADKQAAHEALRESMLFIEYEGLRKLSTGPFWLGKDISLTDIQFMPFFQGHLDNERTDIPAECSRLHSWLDTMVSRPSCQNTAPGKAA
jgi:glutathione S-transferase